MNKKGFTLVELLAVIAILAILVIIALPNVIKLYNNAKKNTFLTEVKTIYKEAATKYITESIKNKKLSYINSNNKYSLDLDAPLDLQYCINLDNLGNVLNMSVMNNNYYIEYTESNNISNYELKDIKERNNKTKMLCSKSDNRVIQVPDKKECTSESSNDTYTDGIYTYTYNKDSKGWSVKLTDLESTNPITEIPCSIINNKPIISTNSMFMNSKASSIDVSGFDTSNVTDMRNMFYNTAATEITGLEYLDTSKVYYMGSMFMNSNTSIANLSGFDTSKVTDMYKMFHSSKIKNLDLTNLNTSSLRNFQYMFYNSGVEFIDITGLDTSRINNMTSLFQSVNANYIIGLNTIDTSNVESMHAMFYDSKVLSIDMSDLNTSKVTDMRAMFWRTKANTINISGIDTSNVTNMGSMFFQSDVSNVIGLNKLNTSKVTNMTSMFYDSKIEYLDLSSFDMDNVTDTTSMFSFATSKKIYAKSKKEKEIFESSVTQKPSSVIVEIKK